MEVIVKLNIDKGVFDAFNNEEDLIKYLKKTKSLEVIDVLPTIFGETNIPEIESIQDIFDFLEDNGIAANNYQEGDNWETSLNFSSDLGEDFWFYINHDNTTEDFIDKFSEYSYDFEPEEHAEPYIEIRGKRGVPNSAFDLIEDAKKIKCFLEDISFRLNQSLKNKNNL
ncbi:MAG: hypothetical protein ACI37Z_05160 [Candidatus Gastranaerophilaceae bacterium]